MGDADHGVAAFLYMRRRHVVTLQRTFRSLCRQLVDAQETLMPSRPLAHGDVLRAVASIPDDGLATCQALPSSCNCPTQPRAVSVYVPCSR